jgi:hypothetical protein
MKDWRRKASDILRACRRVYKRNALNENQLNKMADEGCPMAPVRVGADIPDFKEGDYWIPVETLHQIEAIMKPCDTGIMSRRPRMAS